VELKRPTLESIGHFGDGFPANHLTATRKTEPNYNQVQLTTLKPKQPLKKTRNIYRN